MASTYKMYIIINKDLNLTIGQTAAQVSHITQIIIEDLIKDIHEITPIPSHVIAYKMWQRNPIVICKKATTQELQELSNQPFTKAYVDQITGINLNTNGDPEPVLTSVECYPSKDNGTMMEKYALL